LQLVDNGLIFKKYCIGSGSKRQYFTDYNVKKIGTIRVGIKELKIMLS